MTDFKGPEALVDAILAKLKAEMPARVAKINLQYDDGLQVAAPDETSYFDSALRLIPPNCPAVLVMDGPMTLIPGGEGPHSLLTETRIAVWVIDADSDESALGRRLQRLARAVIESVWDGDPAEMLLDVDGRQVAYNVRPAGTMPGDTFDAENQGGPHLREFYCVVFTATRLEGD